MTPTRASWPRGLLFDLDGTLVDSAADIAAALNVVFSGVGYPTFSVEETKAMVGGGIGKLVERALGAARVDAARNVQYDLTARVKAAYAVRPAVATCLYPGAREVLAHYAGLGLPLAIVTNKPTDISRSILEALEVAPFFRAVIGGTSGFPLKPDGGMIHAALAALSLAADDAVMIGDSAADVGAARAAGVRVIVVEGGYTTHPAQELGADVLIPALDALPRTLEAMRPS